MIEKFVIVLWVIAATSAIYFFWCFLQFKRTVSPYLIMQGHWERQWGARGGVALLVALIAAVAAWVLS